MKVINNMLLSALENVKMGAVFARQPIFWEQKRSYTIVLQWKLMFETQDCNQWHMIFSQTNYKNQLYYRRLTIRSHLRHHRCHRCHCRNHHLPNRLNKQH